jgi:hypothetical protein
MRAALIALAAVAAASPACAAEGPATGTPAASDADALAMQLSNPVAALISVPFQLNWDTGLGPGGDGDRTTLNVQPVIPVSIGADWNLISRTIVPVIWQSDVTPGGGSQSGFGDVLQSVFFSPKAPTASGWIWGVGPALLLPTGNSDFTLDQWAVGPTAVVLKQNAAGWTYGMLVNQLWGVSNSGRLPDVDAAFLQPFVTKRVGPGRTLGLNLEAAYDGNSSQWTVPVNASLSQVLPLGGQLVSVGLGGRAYLDAPRGGPDWGLRLTVTLLFPR